MQSHQNVNSKETTKDSKKKASRPGEILNVLKFQPENIFDFSKCRLNYNPSLDQTTLDCGQPQKFTYKQINASLAGHRKALSFILVRQTSKNTASKTSLVFKGYIGSVKEAWMMVQHVLKNEASILEDMYKAENSSYSGSQQTFNNYFVTKSNQQLLEEIEKTKEALKTLGFEQLFLEDLTGEGSPAQIIKSRFRKLSLKHHPDKNKDNVEKATEEFKIISEANDILNNILGDFKDACIKLGFTNAESIRVTDLEKLANQQNVTLLTLLYNQYTIQMSTALNIEDGKLRAEQQESLVQAYSKLVDEANKFYLKSNNVDMTHINASVNTQTRTESTQTQTTNPQGAYSSYSNAQFSSTSPTPQYKQYPYTSSTNSSNNNSAQNFNASSTTTYTTTNNNNEYPTQNAYTSQSGSPAQDQFPYNQNYYEQPVFNYATFKKKLNTIYNEMEEIFNKQHRAYLEQQVAFWDQYEVWEKLPNQSIFDMKKEQSYQSQQAKYQLLYDKFQQKAYNIMFAVNNDKIKSEQDLLECFNNFSTQRDVYSSGLQNYLSDQNVYALNKQQFESFLVAQPHPQQQYTQQQYTQQNKATTGPTFFSGKRPHPDDSYPNKKTTQPSSTTNQDTQDNFKWNSDPGSNPFS